MKKIASVLIATAMSVLCFALSACVTKYVSHYSSTMMVSSNNSNKASVSFDTFSGTYVIQLNNTGDDKASITYEATLSEGNIKVYYDFNDEKLDLFEIKTDGAVEGETEAFTSSKKIYIIIESDGKCGEGSFSFALKKS